MDKDVLRELGWSEELIAAAAEVTRPSNAPFPVVEVLASSIDMSDDAVGTPYLDVSDAPMAGSTALPPPRSR